MTVVAGPSGATATTYTTTQTLNLPSANFAGSSGGDGWGLTFSQTNVYNIYHHNTALNLQCHNLSTSAVCAGYPKTITTSAAGYNPNFGISAKPAMYLDQSTGLLYVAAVGVQTSGSVPVPGVVCIDTTSSASDPICTGTGEPAGFTPLGIGGDSVSPNTSGSGMINQIEYNGNVYVYNPLNGSAIPATSGGTAANSLLCYVMATGLPCTGQPYAVPVNPNTATVSSASVANATTLNVSSSTSFPTSGTLTVLDGTNTDTVTYTGNTGTSFTGVSGMTYAHAANVSVVQIVTSAEPASSPSDAETLIGSRLFIPVDEGSVVDLTCTDLSLSTPGPCAGWPSFLNVGTDGTGAAPIPYETATGTATGVCYDGANPVWSCYDFTGNAITGTDVTNLSTAFNFGDVHWTGAPAVVGSRVLMSNQATVVSCYNFKTHANCAGFASGLTLSNLGTIYTVTSDPQIPTCIFVNSDNGANQIQDFDALSGGSCGNAPVQVKATDFINNGCTPTGIGNLVINSAVGGTVSSAIINYVDANYDPLTNVGNPYPMAGNPLAANLSSANSGIFPTTLTSIPPLAMTLTKTAGVTSITYTVQWLGDNSSACSTPPPGATIANLNPPSIPLLPNANQSGSSITATWATPASDGGSPITNYTCILLSGFNTPTSFTVQVTGNTCSFSGLDPSQEYMIEVFATNAIGNGPAALAVPSFAAAAPTPTTTTTTPATTTTTPPATTTCHVSVKVYFPVNVTTLSSANTTALTALVQRAIACHVTSLTATGYADVRGTSAYNHWLSVHRALSVATFVQGELNSRDSSAVAVSANGNGVSMMPGSYAVNRYVLLQG